MSDINRRLAKISSIVTARGCLACRHWDETVVQIVRPLPSGESDITPFPAERPERCPSCGRRPTRRTTVVQIVKPADAEDSEVLA